MENRLELFNKTYNTLVTAWNEGKLEQQNCRACAVGNLCEGQREWHDLMYFSSCTDEATLAKARALVDATGYTLQELTLIESAFEKNSNPFSPSREKEYIGLCAVMEVLWKIHGIKDQSLTTLNEVATAKGVTVNA